MESVMDEVMKYYGERAEITIINLDNSKNYELASQYQIRVVPTLIFLNQQGEAFYRHEGYLDADNIKKVFKEIGME